MNGKTVLWTFIAIFILFAFLPFPLFLIVCVVGGAVAGWIYEGVRQEQEEEEEYYEEEYYTEHNEHTNYNEHKENKLILGISDEEERDLYNEWRRNKEKK